MSGSAATTSPPTDGRAFRYPVDADSSPPREPLLIAPPPAPYPHSREHSLTRSRALSASSPRNASPRVIPEGVPGARSKPSTEIERKPSISYGHHRQTSIVHGVQHSRNPSLLSSGTSSPLSPQRILASGASFENANYSGGSSIRKSPSSSTLNSVKAGNPPGASTTHRNLEYNGPPRRLERMHSGRVKRAHEQQLSQNRIQPHSNEVKTVGEYALHHLFTSFIAEADERIERCMMKPGEPEPRIETICGPGADPAFDQLISSLGHINRHKPNSLIDSVIHWRKRKADEANILFQELRSIRDETGATVRTGRNGSISSPTAPPTSQEIARLEQSVVVADRQSTVSIYILCRVLIEIIGQTTLKALNGHNNSLKTASRLEEVIYGQLQGADPDFLATSPVIRANWVVRGQLLGVMSGVNFQEVVDRFVKDLEEAQKRLVIKGLSDPKFVSKTVLLVQSMRWLQVRASPPESWSQSCKLLQLLARLFLEVRGRAMKHAYAELFEHLLLPIAATATTELNAPKWKEVISMLHPKLSQMLSKAEHWSYIYPLQTVLICASPTEQFIMQWLSHAHSSQPKARDRSARSHALKAICRLVWRYLYRPNSDSPNAVMRKLDEIVKLVFSGGKRALISTEPSIADPLIQLIRIIGYKLQDLCFRNIIFPLMNSDIFSGHEKDLKIENLDPERTVIGIRAFLAVMTDLEKHEPPPFPSRFECDSMMDSPSRSSTSHRRTRSQGFALSAGRTERLSRPVLTTNLNDISKDYYGKFCKILGQLTIICDNTFGGQAVLDEKFASQIPKTPMAEAFTFNRRDELMNPTDVRQNYYDLFHVAVEALPRCLSPHLPINSLVNLLCTGTAHVQSHIATSSAQALKSIARQSYAQQVTIGFARFIFNFDDRYATVSDGSLLGPGHIESTLKLYVELLQIWIDDIQQRTRKAVTDPVDEEEHAPRPLPLDLSSVLAHVDEVEAHGLFFLCSPSRVVRAIAINVLRLITNFDKALGKPIARIISILEGSSQRVIDANDDRLTTAERSRLQKGLREGGVNNTLVELCSSDVAHDATLWFKVFPNIVRLSAETCLHAVALTRELVCQRLSHSYKLIGALADGQKTPAIAVEQGHNPLRPAPRLNSTSPEIVIEQWKIHLIFACTTLTNIGSASSHHASSAQSIQHTRKSSKSSATSQEKIASATELFSKVVPFLSVGHSGVRAAAVAGLGATNATLFQTLLETLSPLKSMCNAEAKERLESHQRSGSSPRRNQRADSLRTEITHLLSLTSHHLQNTNIPGEEYVRNYIVDYVKHLRIFLSDTDIQGELEFQKLRTHFCMLVEGLYDSIRNLKDSNRWMSFQSRQATFALMENWCGFSPNEPQLRRQQDHLRRSILEREGDSRNRGIINSAIEKEKNELQVAALSAMAMLCAGPLNLVADGRIPMQFDVRRMLSWINAIYEAPSDRVHVIGRKALQNLILHNLDQPYLMAQTVRMCYIARLPKALGSYFEVVTRVLIDDTSLNTPFWRIVCAGLYTLGNEDSQIRLKSARLLRTLEERQGKTSKLQDLDISVSDKTTTVYKLAQFEVSRRLANQHPKIAFHVFSEFSAYFNELEPDHQRNMVTGMLPWIQTIELQLDPKGGPTTTSYMLLVNLFEITVKSSITLHNEIQALWQALAAGPYAGNVQLVLDFIIKTCLDKKEQNFVIYAKQITVFMSKTMAGTRVVEYLLMQISPKTMVTEQNSEPMQPPTDKAGLPYIADLAVILPSGSKQSGLSLGQLSMILLVDLVVSPIQLPVDKIPALLQVILVQWDQYISIVQDQAREMLVHLIHELVISKIEPDSTDPDKRSIEDFLESIRQHDPRITWSYDDSEVRPTDDGNHAVSTPMAYVIGEVVRILSITYPTIRVEWGKVTMQWATSCAVRHVACRSFQIFRCVSTTLDSQMLSDMLARLSNTIADDDNHDYLIFSLEILKTLRCIIHALDPLDLFKYPQLFWTACACLDTIFEREFQEGLEMLSAILNKIDLSDPAVLKILRDSKPEDWDGEFDGLHSLIEKGVWSSESMCRTLQTMEKLIKLPSSDIVGNDDRLLMAILANLPRYLHHFQDKVGSDDCLESARTLASAAESQDHVNLSRLLENFAKGNIRREDGFLSECVAQIRDTFFPDLEFQSLVFLLGMVNNQTPWFKVKAMQILCVMIPGIDMRQPQIASQGPDLISPLLRLLQTEHCQQALAVLDNVIDMTGTPLDNKHLRMSMAGSHSSRATRKEYDRTQSLYGIPEESGWSIPMPAIHSARTRANVHAIFYTLSINETQDSTSTPDIEFHKDDFSYDPFFVDRNANVLIEEPHAVEGNIGDLAEKLDTLDDFFDDALEPVSQPASNESTRYSSRLIEERENLYDQQTLPILRSLKRNPSITSFQTGFAELRYPPPPREPSIMNPAAFAQSPPASTAQPPPQFPVRPGLHNRSITSPAMTLQRSPPRLTRGASDTGNETSDEQPEPFSDDEIPVPIGRAHTHDEPHHHHYNPFPQPSLPSGGGSGGNGSSTTRPLHNHQQYPAQQQQQPQQHYHPSGGFIGRFGSGIRRLTSTTGTREALRSAVATATTPKVPKLPPGYSKEGAGPMSAEP